MQLQFKNKHIYFALESIWGELDYRFKYHINQLVTSNSDDEFLQTVTVDEDSLLRAYKSLSGKPEGVAKAINNELLLALQPQLLAAANMAEVQQGDDPNEAARILIAIGNVNNDNEANKDAKILNGKTQILA